MPDPVAAQDQRPRLAIPERDGELAPRLVEHRLAVVFVEMDPRLGVAARRQAMPAGQELPAQLGILEQLAVEGDPDRAVLVADRLPAAGQVDDRQPPGPERHARLDVELLVVGTAVGDRAGHRQQSLMRKLPRPCQVDCTGDAAHADASLAVIVLNARCSDDSVLVIEPEVRPPIARMPRRRGAICAL